MKDAIAALSLFASAVTAQQLTSAPKAVFRQASSLQLGGVLAGANDYQICLDSGKLILDCSQKLGGPENIQNLPPDEIFGCACCDGSREVYSDFASCSSYMATQLPGFSSEAKVYGDLATMCSAMGTCSGSAGASATGSGPSRTVESSRPTSLINTAVSGTITAAAPVSQCSQMVGMFSSCLAETPRFNDLGYKSQAKCYCCASSRGQTTGTLTWTNEVDQYASACWNWAGSSATDTAWHYASTFATFCENFSSVCDGLTIAAQTQETTTDSSTNTQDGGAVTVTVTGGQSTQTNQPDAAAGLRAGCAGGIVALVAGLLML